VPGVQNQSRRPLADRDNWQAPAEIAREIIEDLEAALEQFRLIEADLNPGTDRED